MAAGGAVLLYQAAEAQTAPYLEGRVALGPVSGAVVSAYALNPDGTRGAELATASSALDGSYRLQFNHQPPQHIVLEASGGTFADPATGETVALAANAPLTAAVTWGTVGRASITPLTHIAAARAIEIVGDGGDIAQAITSTNASVSMAFPVEHVVAVDPFAGLTLDAGLSPTLAEQAYEATLGGVAFAAEDLGVSTPALVQALARDGSDGAMDGLDHGDVVLLAESEGSLDVPQLPANASPELIIQGVNEFLEEEPSAWAFDVPPPIAPDSPPIGLTAFSQLVVQVPILPAWTSGESGSVKLPDPVNGTPPYSCSAVDPLPGRFTISQTCTLEGVPTLAPGTSRSISPPFRVRITDSTPETAGGPLSVDVSLYVVVVERPPSLRAHHVNCVIGEDGFADAARDCGDRLLATPEAGGPTYFKLDSLVYGGPPFGMWIGTDGRLTGRAKQQGTYGFSICAVDQTGLSECGRASVSIGPAGQAPSQAPTSSSATQGTQSLRPAPTPTDRQTRIPTPSPTQGPPPSCDLAPQALAELEAIQSEVDFIVSQYPGLSPSSQAFVDEQYRQNIAPAWQQVLDDLGDLQPEIDAYLRDRGDSLEAAVTRGLQDVPSAAALLSVLIESVRAICAP